MKVEDLDEVEEGDVRKYCRHCGKQQTRIVRNGTRTVWGACENKECFRYVDLRQVDTWTREEHAELPPVGAEAIRMLYLARQAANATT